MRGFKVFFVDGGSVVHDLSPKERLYKDPAPVMANPLQSKPENTRETGAAKGLGGIRVWG